MRYQATFSQTQTEVVVFDAPDDEAAREKAWFEYQEQVGISGEWELDDVRPLLVQS